MQDRLKIHWSLSCSIITFLGLHSETVCDSRSGYGSLTWHGNTTFRPHGLHQVCAKCVHAYKLYIVTET